MFVFVSFRGFEMQWLLIVVGLFFLFIRIEEFQISVFVCVCCWYTQTWTCTYTYVWFESSYAWFASLPFFSPVDQFSVRKDGRLLWRKLWDFFWSWPVCFSDTQPGYLTCWWITQTVQSKFAVFIEERVWRHLMYSSHDILSFFPLLWQCVYKCVLRSLLFKQQWEGRSQRPVKRCTVKSELCQGVWT